VKTIVTNPSRNPLLIFWIILLGISHVAVNKVAYKKENEKKLYSWSKEDQNRFEDFLLHYCDDIG
jgi:hypothetical protein